MAAKIRVQIERVNDNLIEGISKRIGDVGFAAYAAIIFASPHDTGHFRQNWQIGINQRPTGIVEGTDKAGQTKIKEADRIFANYEFGDKSRPNVIVFSNNVAYALRLNEGHSKQAASGFVQRALRAGIKAVNAGGKII